MWFSDLSIRRPVLATVMSIILVLFGLVGLSFLSVREFPDIDPPVVSVLTVYPGASSEIIETTVTERLEDELIGIEGIRSMASVSREGASNVVIEFELDRDINVAAQDVRDRVSRARGRLPDDIEEPVISKQDTDAGAIMWLSLHGKNYSPIQITDYADRTVKDQLQTIDGVGNIIIGGAREYAMRLWLDPALMAARKISVLDVEKALREENVEIPSGRIESRNREFTIRTLGELKTPGEFNRLIIKREHGAPVYLRDIGHAEIGPRDDRTLVRFNGSPAVGLGIVKQSKANTLSVAKDVKGRLDSIRATLPPGLRMDIAFDSSVFIQRSIDEVTESLFIAFGLVVLVIFLFLRSARATLIPALSIPISLISTFTMMYFLGYTINTITLLGLTLAIGLVVDDTIVVLENIYRRIELGESPMEAAFAGTKEIGFAIIATTAVLVAVFLPILFMGGILGRILKEFAVVVAGSVLISGFISLTLTPMMCARILRPESHNGEPSSPLPGPPPREGRGQSLQGEEGQAAPARQQLRGADGRKRGWNPLSAFLDGFNILVEATANRFQSVLTMLMGRKILVFTLVTLLMILTAGMFTLLPREFLPVEDRSTILTFVAAPEGATMAYTDKAVRQAEAVYRQTPEVETMFAAVALGMSGPGQVNNGMMFVHLHPREERQRTQQQVVSSLMGPFMSIPEALVFPINPPSSPVQSFGKPISMAVQATANGDIHQLAEISDRIKARASQEIPGFVNVDNDLKLNKPQLEVTINREKAALLGVKVADVARSMQILLSGLDISTFQFNGKRYDVMVQAMPSLRMTPDQLSSIYVSGREDMLVPLSNLIDYHETVMPKELNHYNRMRAATIDGAIMEIPGANISMGGVLTKLQSIAQEEMAPGMRVAWRGEAKEFFDANSATYFAFLLAVVIVFLVLAAQFESWSDPLIVIFTVPLAIAGAVLTLFVLSWGSMLLKMLPQLAQWQPVNYSLNVYSQIGLVMLVGLVTKNGILIVEFANQIREQDPLKSVREAVIEAARIRFRPIVMTTISTVFGAIPIAVGLGAGVDGRKPLGAVIVGGMTLATVLTLFVIPMVYDFIKGRRDRKAAILERQVFPPASGLEHEH